MLLIFRWFIDAFGPPPEIIDSRGRICHGVTALVSVAHSVALQNIVTHSVALIARAAEIEILMGKISHSVSAVTNITHSVDLLECA